MSLAEIRMDVGAALRRVDDRLRKERAALAAGPPADKVEAAGELAFLEQQKLGLERRLAELDHLPDGTWPTIREWLREEAAGLERRLATWTARE